MDILLTPKINQWISEKVASGLYRSTDEVILEGLRLLKRQEEQRLAMIQDSAGDSGGGQAIGCWKIRCF